MMNKRVFSIISALFLLAAPLTGAAEDIDVTGNIDIGIKNVDQDNDSSKFNEYKDDDDDIYVNEINLFLTDDETNRIFEFKGNNISRSNQDIYLRYSIPGKWRLDLDWSETPHLISNQAKTPYDYLGNGRYRVSEGIVDAIQISDVGSAGSWTATTVADVDTNAPNTWATDVGSGLNAWGYPAATTTYTPLLPGAPGEDFRINSVLTDSVHAVELGTHREKGKVGFTYHISDKTALSFDFSQETKEGSIITGAPIGDRPPRSMTVQLPEPVDYRTEDYKISAEHNMEKVQVVASYLYSKFYNDVDTLTWNSLFHDAGYFVTGATDYDQIRRRIYESKSVSGTLYSTNGRMSLNPDNTYNHVSIKVGADLPMDSRLNLSIAQGKMEQDEDLLPYATSNFGAGTSADISEVSADTGGRVTGDAEIITTFLNVDYVLQPAKRLNAKLFYRTYEVDNKTTESEFDYYTQDTNSQNYRNERKNLAYGYKRDNSGIDLTYYMKRMGTLGLGYEKELVERDYRETAETDEDIVKISYKVRPAKGVSFRAKYLKAERDGGTYDGEATDQSYSYDPTYIDDNTPSNALQYDNPLMGFGNAPGLRKYDVTDRERDELDLSVSINPTNDLGVNLFYQSRKNDYDSPIKSSITTWNVDPDGNTLTNDSAFITAQIDPTQLGLIKDESNSYSLDINYIATNRLMISGFYSRDIMESDQRGRYLNENNRIDGDLSTKDWADLSGDYIWDATITDTTDTANISLNYAAIPKKLDLTADFTHSKGIVEIDYSAGAEIVEGAALHEHGEWSSPEDTEFKTDTVKLGASFHMTKRLTFGFNYTFEKYEVEDWQQEGNDDYQVSLSEQYVADQDSGTEGTSNDRVGSRLVRLTDYVAPDYEVHMAMVSMKLKF